MKPFATVSLLFALLVPAVVYAGQVYGTIVFEGQGLKSAAIEIQCGKDEPVKGSTAADGSYRINVPQQGQCTLTLPGYDGAPSASIFSGPNPAAYNYELAKLANGKYELKRR
jgi:hypothetical protein